MFESDLATSEEPVRTKRRAFLQTSASVAAGMILWWLKQPSFLQAGATQSSPEVTIIEFSDSGERLKKMRVPKVVKTEEEWRKQLSPGAFAITRHADTEIAFTGQYWNLHQRGFYRCICCGNALFSSDTKFDSGTGWPSFWAPLAEENIRTARDLSLGMVRTAVSCSECDAHLGHLFDDGPAPTYLRYCMNSASLRFIARNADDSRK